MCVLPKLPIPSDVSIGKCLFCIVWAFSVIVKSLLTFVRSSRVDRDKLRHQGGDVDKWNIFILYRCRLWPRATGGGAGTLQETTTHSNKLLWLVTTNNFDRYGQENWSCVDSLCWSRCGETFICLYPHHIRTSDPSYQGRVSGPVTAAVDLHVLENCRHWK